MEDLENSTDDERIPGRIYKLSSTIDDKYYYGSTVNSLETRYNQHLNHASSSKNLSKMYQHYNTIGWNNVLIQLILEVPVTFEYELRIYEAKYICKCLRDPNCLNSKNPFYYRHLKINFKSFLELPVSEIVKLEIQYNKKLGEKMTGRINKRLNTPELILQNKINSEKYLAELDAKLELENKIKLEKENEKNQKKILIQKNKEERQSKKDLIIDKRFEKERIISEKNENIIISNKKIVPQIESHNIISFIDNCLVNDPDNPN
jgi:hypothetical protein